MQQKQRFTKTKNILNEQQRFKNNVYMLKI
jgi:hypothetical protein